MKRFQDRVYASTPRGLLIWEPSWETFRPVHSVVWNPIHKQVEPFFGPYTSDIFDVEYGFGTSELHDFCVEFTDDAIHRLDEAAELLTPSDFWQWIRATNLTWIGDRSVVLHPCTGTPNRKAYLTAYSLRAKTCKRAPRNLRGTRKIHKHQ
jgi:hypothetical protein